MHVQQFRLKGTYEIKKNRKTSSRKFAGGEEKQSGVCAFHRVKGTGDSSARDRLSRPRFSYACSEYHMGQQNCATYFTVRTAFFYRCSRMLARAPNLNLENFTNFTNHHQLPLLLHYHYCGVGYTEHHQSSLTTVSSPYIF